MSGEGVARQGRKRATGMATGDGISTSAVRALLQRLHSTASQEAAAARIALAVWRRAVARGDAAGADAAAGEAVARLEALFDQLAAVEGEGRRLIDEAERA